MNNKYMEKDFMAEENTNINSNTDITGDSNISENTEIISNPEDDSEKRILPGISPVCAPAHLNFALCHENDQDIKMPEPLLSEKAPASLGLL